MPTMAYLAGKHIEFPMWFNVILIVFCIVSIIYFVKELIEMRKK